MKLFDECASSLPINYETVEKLIDEDEKNEAKKNEAKKKKIV